MPVTLHLEGADRLTAALRRSPQVVATEQVRAMTRSLLLVEGDARRNVRQDTRQLMNSITHRQRMAGEALVGEVGPSLGRDRAGAVLRAAEAARGSSAA